MAAQSLNWRFLHRAISPQHFIASSSWDKSIYIWDAQTGLLVAGPLRGHTKGVSSLAFSPDGIHVVSRSNNDTIRMWDLATKSSVAVFSTVPLSPIQSVVSSPDCTRIASSSFGIIFVWDMQTRDIIIDPSNKHSNSINSMLVFPDDRRIVSGSSDRIIHIYNVETGDTIGEPLVGYTGYAGALVISSDGTRIVSGPWDLSIRDWDVEAKTHIGKPSKGHTGLIEAVAFLSDGARIFSGSFDITIRVWKVLGTLEMGGPFEQFDPVDAGVTASTTVILLSDRLDAATRSLNATQASLDVEIPVLGVMVGTILFA